MNLPAELVEGVYAFVYALKLNQLHSELLQKVEQSDDSDHCRGDLLKLHEDRWRRMHDYYSTETIAKIRWGRAWTGWSSHNFFAGIEVIYIRSLEQNLYYKNMQYMRTLPHIQYQQKEVVANYEYFYKV